MNIKSIIADLVADLIFRRTVRIINGSNRNSGDIAWLSDHCTMWLNAGRSAGHTTAVYELFNKEQDIAIVGNSMWKREYESNQIPAERVFDKTFNGALGARQKALLSRDSIVWVDAASWWCKPKELEDLYFAIIGEVGYRHAEDRWDHYPVIVLLG